MQSECPWAEDLARFRVTRCKDEDDEEEEYLRLA
jgi:hypothetical protein